MNTWMDMGNDLWLRLARYRCFCKPGGICPGPHSGDGKSGGGGKLGNSRGDVGENIGITCGKAGTAFRFIQAWGVKPAAAAKSLQSCLTLCNPIDGSPPDFPTPGIPQARTLKWVAIVFSNA